VAVIDLSKFGFNGIEPPLMAKQREAMLNDEIMSKFLFDDEEAGEFIKDPYRGFKMAYATMAADGNDMSMMDALPLTKFLKAQDRM
jgi:hypothetical protein